jgi:hypothetical protein
MRAGVPHVRLNYDIGRGVLESLVRKLIGVLSAK